MTSTNDLLSNICKLKEGFSFAVHAEDRISNPKQIFSGESICQSAQNRKFEIHCAFVVSMSLT